MTVAAPVPAENETKTPTVSETLTVHRSKIAVKPQVRKEFNQQALQELADSIKESGIIQRLIVRRLPKYTLAEPDMITPLWRILRDGQEFNDGHPVMPCTQNFQDETTARAMLRDWEGTQNGCEFELVCGERRLRASKIAGLDEIPVEVKTLSNEEVLTIQLVENASRKDLTAIEEAEAYGRMKTELGYSVEQIIQKTGKARSTVFAALQLLKLAPAVREAIATGKLQPTIGNLIAGIPTQKLQEKALKEIVENKQVGRVYDPDFEEGETDQMSFRRAKVLIRESYMLDLKDAEFNPKEENIFADNHDVIRKTNGGDEIYVAACADCPMRSGNAPHLGIHNPDVCTSPECFKAKTKAHMASLERKAISSGATKVLTGKEAEKCFQFYSDEPSFKAGYVDCDTVWPGMKKTVGDILKSKMPAPIVAIKKGKQHKVWGVAEIEKALQEAGAKPKPFEELKQANTNAYAKQEAERKEKSRRSEAIAAEAHALLLEKLRKKLKMGDLLRMFVETRSLYSYAQRRNISEEEAAKVVDKMDEVELMVVAFELLFLLHTVDWDGSINHDFAVQCERYGVDLRKVGNELKLDEKKEEPAKEVKAKGKKGGKGK